MGFAFELFKLCRHHSVGLEPSSFQSVDVSEPSGYSHSSAPDSSVCCLCQTDCPCGLKKKKVNPQTNKHFGGSVLGLSLGLPRASPLAALPRGARLHLAITPSKPKKPRCHGDGRRGLRIRNFSGFGWTLRKCDFTVRIYGWSIYLTVGVSVTNDRLANQLPEQSLSQHSLLILQSANQKLFRRLLS